MDTIYFNRNIILPNKLHTSELSDTHMFPTQKPVIDKIVTSLDTGVNMHRIDTNVCLHYNYFSQCSHIYLLSLAS